MKNSAVKRKIDLQRYDRTMASTAYVVLLLCFVAGIGAEDPEIKMNVVRNTMVGYYFKLNRHNCE